MKKLQALNQQVSWQLGASCFQLPGIELHGTSASTQPTVQEAPQPEHAGTDSTGRVTRSHVAETDCTSPATTPKAWRQESTRKSTPGPFLGN